MSPSLSFPIRKNESNKYSMTDFLPRDVRAGMPMKDSPREMGPNPLAHSLSAKSKRWLLLYSSVWGLWFSFFFLFTK